MFTQLNIKTVLFQTIQSSISTQFNSIWPIDRTLSGATNSRPEWTREQWQWKGALHYPKLQYYWNLLIRLFNVISSQLSKWTCEPACVITWVTKSKLLGEIWTTNRKWEIKLTKVTIAHSAVSWAAVNKVRTNRVNGFVFWISLIIIRGDSFLLQWKEKVQSDKKKKEKIQ